VRKNRGCIQARAACQVSDRGRVRGRDRCETRRIFSWSLWPCCSDLRRRRWEQLLSAEVVKDQFSMLAERAGDLLHRLYAGPHGLAAPLVEELAGPSGRIVVPELLKGFLEKIRADGFQVVAEEVAEGGSAARLQDSRRV